MRVVLVMLIMLGGLMVWADPFFHYHKPPRQLVCPIDSERYQNDNVNCNFTYDAVLTDTSTMENFKANRSDSLFSVTPVKIPYAGGCYREVDQAVKRALAYNPQIGMVCGGLDRSFLFYPKDQWNPAAPSPEYLTDGNLFDDVDYIFNREVIFGTIPSVFAGTKAGGRTTTFGGYMHWTPERDWDRETILKTYDREPCEMKAVPFTEEDRRTVMENLERNVLIATRANSQVTLYYFTPPYNTGWWDNELTTKGEFKRRVKGYRLMAYMLLECKNVCLFAFDDQFDITYNLDRYMGAIRYSEDTGDQLLEQMAAGEHVLTDDTVDFYLDKVMGFYASYDYGSIYE